VRRELGQRVVSHVFVFEISFHFLIVLVNENQKYRVIDDNKLEFCTVMCLLFNVLSISSYSLLESE